MSWRPDEPAHAVCRRAAHRLEAAGWTREDARIDAEVLAREIVGWDVADWIVHQHEPVPPAFRAEYDAAVARRLRHEPVAYIVGRREFYGRPFRVTPDVLIPRPETELVIDEALRLVPAGSQLEAADVGTGSGCLAITLALERPDLRVTATDTSARALAVAGAHAPRVGARERIRFVRMALLDGVGPASLDLAVSNPPYVPDVDRAGLMPDVRDYEPAAALFGGPDGLDLIRALLPAAAQALKPGGWLIMEIGAGQAADVSRLATASGLSVARIAADLAGIPRALVAQRPATA